MYNKLPDDLRHQLEQLTLVFLDRIEFRGVDGLTITDEIRVMTSAQACILLLNQGTFFTNKLRSAVIHPKAYSATSHDTIAGETTEKKIAVQGQSWENGLVVLSWDNTRTGAANAKDGRNLVIHEFAHHFGLTDEDLRQIEGHYDVWRRAGRGWRRRGREVGNWEPWAGRGQRIQVLSPLPCR